MTLNIIIVEKTGILKSLAIKEFKEDELFKKCGFKKAEDFVKQHEWNMKTEGCLLYTSPSPRDRQKSRMPSSA